MSKRSKLRTETASTAAPSIERQREARHSPTALSKAARVPSERIEATASLTICLNANGDMTTLVNGNHVTIPHDLNGLRMIKQLLEANELALKEKAKRITIATNAKPTQGMIDAFLRNKELEKANEKAKQLNELAEIF